MDWLDWRIHYRQLFCYPFDEGNLLIDIERMRPFSDLSKPDPRHFGRGDAPVALYESLAEIQLNDSVPVKVRQLFETAKNLSLYTWFVYRFHPVASFIGYSCLEAALLPLVMKDPNFPKMEWKGWFPSFRSMLNHAVSHGWLRNEGFENARLVAKGRARHKAMIAQIEEMNAAGINEMPSREPEEEQIEAELAGLPYARNLVNGLPELRNAVAHGKPFLDDGSLGSLRVVAEAINQLYPEPEAAPTTDV